MDGAPNVYPFALLIFVVCVICAAAGRLRRHTPSPDNYNYNHNLNSDVSTHGNGSACWARDDHQLSRGNQLSEHLHGEFPAGHEGYADRHARDQLSFWRLERRVHRHELHGHD